MTDQIYQSVQYPLKKVVRILTNLENIDSLPPEYLTPESRAMVIREIEGFISFWEGEGRESLKDLVNNLRDKLK